MKVLRLRSDAVQWREIGDEIVAVDLRSSTYLSTNRSAMLLWRELAEGATRERLVELIVAIYGIDTKQAEADVDRFLGELEAQELLEQ